ncbi:MAG: GNAT family protein [Paracoccaceae bacterium]
MEFRVDDEITLKLLQPSDAETVFELVDSNRTYLRQWLPWLDHNTGPEDSREFIEEAQKQFEASKGFACGVFFENDLVGMCGYNEICEKSQSVQIGYWVAEDHQRKGIISRCSRFLIDHAFEELKSRKVFMFVAEQNTKSRAICERLGFTIEGTLPDAEDLYGNWVDHVRYAMSADRWHCL